MKENLKKLHDKRLFLKPNSKMFCVEHFIVLMITKKLTLTTPQVMCCILCHNNLILNLNPKTQTRRRLIIYNRTNDLTTLSKNVNSYNFNIF